MNLFGWKRNPEKKTSIIPTEQRKTEQPMVLDSVGTNRKQPPKGHDAAVSCREEDYLERWPVASSIYRTIKAAPPDWSTRIGLYGPWGSGKTSVLNFLEKIAESKGDIVVRFSAWNAIGESGVIALFYTALTDRLKRQGVQPSINAWSKDILRKFTGVVEKFSKQAGTAASELDSYHGVSVAAAISGLGVAAGALLQYVVISTDDLKKLHELLGDRRVIVFIDDLDRSDPKSVPKTLLALRELLDWPQFAFVLAFDREVIGEALSEYSKAYGESAQQFLDKIIDVPYALPSAPPKQVARLAEEALKKCADFIPCDIRAKVCFRFPDNPRQVKLIARALGVMKEVATRHSETELHWEAIILQTILRHSAPKTAVEVEKLFATDGGTTVSLEAASDKESSESRNNLISNAMLLSGVRISDRDYNYLFSLAFFILGLREAHSEECINYEMNLVVREPCFTIKEYSDLANEWYQSKSDHVVDDILNAKCEQLYVSRIEAAQSLLRKVIPSYKTNLSMVGGHQSLDNEKRCYEMANIDLNFAAYLWGNCTVREVVHERGAVDVCLSLYESLPSKVLDAEGNSRGEFIRELEIIKSALDECHDPVDFFINRILGTIIEIPKTMRSSVMNGIYVMRLSKLSFRLLLIMHLIFFMNLAAWES
ncbi:P-loop NTPase fold protein [Pseudomonas sp. NPDC087336]|uniref:KAP family P-loop NTPase fold protein n=1 Tax=Pseudomonas sp. NPDC087336 TaxID=3364436 RepID=UPI00381E0059